MQAHKQPVIGAPVGSQESLALGRAGASSFIPVQEGHQEGLGLLSSFRNLKVSEGATPSPHSAGKEAASQLLSNQSRGEGEGKDTGVRERGRQFTERKTGLF